MLSLLYNFLKPKKMKKQQKLTAAYNFFKKSYACARGGSQTVILQNGKSMAFDDREDYSGRGGKYNDSIRHDNIGEVRVARKEYSSFLKMMKEQEFFKKAVLQAAGEKAKRISEAAQQGIYSVENRGALNYIELSKEEEDGHFFDANRLAKTLGITVEDAVLLNSPGKTYVFARKTDTGEIIELYHPSLSCNDLSISFSVVPEERVDEFNHDEWAGAPYADLVGQTTCKNHFVC